jgi:hypothetical protein
MHQAKRPDKERRRIMLEGLESVRDMRLYWEPKAGAVHRVKALLRKAGVPVPRPRKGN